MHRRLLLVLCSVCTLAFAEPDSLQSQTSITAPTWISFNAQDSALLSPLKTLDEFPYIDSFENFYNANTETHIKSTAVSNNDSITTHFYRYFKIKIWQREIAISHAKLEKSLDNNGRRILAKADSSWDNMVDMTQRFIYQILEQIYSKGNCGSKGDSLYASAELALIIPMYKIHAILIRGLSGVLPTNTTNSANYWDKALNEFYKTLYAKLSNNDKELIKQAQRQWINARDAQIQLNEYIYTSKYEGKTHDGSLDYAFDHDLLAFFIMQRTLLLRDILALPDCKSPSDSPLPYFILEK
jgi:uncharacterized protein YecT (DUF1311 family)